MNVLEALSSDDDDDPLNQLKLATFAYVGLQLRDATSRFNRVKINDNVLSELKEACRKYFNACSLLLGRITPTVWTIGYAVPYHTEVLFEKFALSVMS